MIWLTFLPAVLTLALAAVLSAVPLRLHPAWTGRLLATVAATTVVATLGTLVFIALNYAATLFPGAADRLPEWVLFGDDQPVHTALGVPALGLTVLSAVITARLCVRWAAEVRDAQHTARNVVDSDTPLAVAVPGRHGGIIVSRGLLHALDQEQLQVVFHHEASHLRHRHHRYLALGALAAGMLPLLKGLNARLRFCLERWADEDTAEAVGDRTLVAHTIAHVALSQSSAGPTAPPFPAFTDSGVLQRVQALLDTAPSKNSISGPVLLTSAGLATGALASVAWQVDHALRLALL
ncbi:M56 family metallopeptidase [Actinomadura sp. 9N407]|uniref:M56 family metallopeptidase n=1 Tax=Actinomadura sp. 9N407 TaxID=3375154 RepID=UPI0037B21D55